MILNDLSVNDPGFQKATLGKKMLQLGPPSRKHPRLILMSFSSELEQYKVLVLPPNGPFQNKIQLQQILELWGTLQGCKHKLPVKLEKKNLLSICDNVEFKRVTKVITELEK